MKDNIAIARSYYYEFFAIPFFFNENDSKFKLWKEQLRYLKQSPIEEKNIKDFEILEKFSFEEFKAEQNLLFFDYSFANVPLTASFYDEGRDDGFAKELVLKILRKSKYRKNESCKDGEDFIGFIFYAMSSLLKDKDDKENNLSSELFKSVINDFVDEMSKFMKENKGSNFFTHFSNLIDTFFAFERAVLGAVKPVKDKSAAKESIKKQPYLTNITIAKDKYDWSDLDL
ncbi:putative formate dehydrogenase-specific chaperone [Campylobacter blaseri]|uniref:Formate dehydrogenase-specific chaperone n=1 Tax=Campylobacter blaseri TaxID=2042961 RepID=A0A2P8R428_9BACT|nr:molecular chaperone TorD family protein [Campylobacter blaseri]PSM53264.1 hypothetical protein CQ405_01600 [Campylobacter blaseri]PSM54730.1 hypothetical protein CRN67_01600 [Campylobacter blaseri]QKF86787.1 putative formate dehydrogenase-specific chaperone [Campylobacter blaseri]